MVGDCWQGDSGCPADYWVCQDDTRVYDAVSGWSDYVVEGWWALFFLLCPFLCLPLVVASFSVSLLLLLPLFTQCYQVLCWMVFVYWDICVRMRERERGGVGRERLLSWHQHDSWLVLVLGQIRNSIRIVIGKITIQQFEFLIPKNKL